jgi:hypothetical protein
MANHTNGGCITGNFQKFPKAIAKTIYPCYTNENIYIRFLYIRRLSASEQASLSYQEHSSQVSKVSKVPKVPPIHQKNAESALSGTFVTSVANIPHSSQDALSLFLSS